MKKILFPSFFVLFVIASAYFFFIKKIQLPSESGSPVACTMEALMCPDGSGVGREGKDCAFRACNYTGPYTGKLSKQGEQFILILGAQVSTTQEVSYSMPLVASNTAELGSLLGKYVTASGVFTTGSMLAVNHIEEVTQAGNEVTLSIGQTGYANGVRITLNKKISDSRCPVDVECIVAGFTSFEVTLKTDTDQEVVTLASNQAPYAIDAFKVSIINVTPTTKSTVVIEPSQYKVTFKVENLK